MRNRRITTLFRVSLFVLGVLWLFGGVSVVMAREDGKLKQQQTDPVLQRCIDGASGGASTVWERDCAVAVDTYLKTGNKFLLADALFATGLGHARRSNINQALEFYGQALLIQRENVDHSGQAITLISIGLVYSDLSQPQRALEFYEQALPILHQTGNRLGEAATMNRIGTIYSDLNQPQRALEFLDQALVIRRQIHDHRGEAATMSNIGNVYRILSQPQRALEFLEQALPIQRAISDFSGEVVTLNNIGHVYKNLSQPQRALEFYEQALLISRAASDHSSEAATLSNIGNVYSDLSQPQRALEFYEQALVIKRQISDHSGEAATLGNIGSVYSDLSQPQRALEFLEQALHITRQFHNRNGEAITLSNIGNVYSNLSQPQRALEFLEQALPIQREIGDHRGEATTLNSIGAVYSNLSQSQRALEFYEQALPIQREIEDLRGEASTLNNIGDAYSNLSQPQRALEFLEQALVIRRQISDRNGEAVTLSNIGNVYSVLSQPQRALEFYEQALPIQREISDHSGEAITLVGIGHIYSDLSRPQHALDFYEQALPIFRQIGDRQGEGAVLNSIGAVYGDLSQPQRALEFFEQALPIQREIGDHSDEAATLNNIGTVYSDLSQPQRALEFFEQALPIQREIGDRRGEAITLSNIAIVNSVLNQPQRALEFYKQAILLRESLRGQIRSVDIQRTLAASDSSLYQFAVRLLMQSGDHTAAFNLAERSRAFALLQTLGNRRLSLASVKNPELLKREADLHDSLISIENALSAPDISLTRTAELIDRRDQTQREYSRVLSDLERVNPEAASLVQVSAKTLTETQAMLDPNVTLLSYYLTDSDTYAFVLTHDQFTAVTLPVTSTQLISTIAAFKSSGLALNGSITPTFLVDLHTWLIQPVLPFLKTTAVGIIPHHELHSVPFAALSDGAQLFGARFTLFYLPSSSVLGFVKDKASRVLTDTLVLGNPVNAAVAPLPFAEREAQAIAGAFGTTALLGGDATESLLRTRAPVAGIIHIAAHGQYNPAQPQFSRIILAQAGQQEDGMLNAYEVYELDLGKAALVVLSACEALEQPRGRADAGDDIIGLTRAFLYGSPTVVTTLWSVNDESSAALMTAFYEHLKAGVGKAEALKQAQADIRSQSKWAHPYYWAGYVLSGDPGKLTTPPPPAQSPGLCASAFILPAGLLAAAGACIKRRRVHSF